jgi:predicted acylesterase/phospholipase RssA
MAQNPVSVRRTLAALTVLGLAAAIGCVHDRREARPLVARPAPPAAAVAPPVPPKSVLVLSGGGMNGAYTAGVLAGWTKAGNRPTFDVVTGVSTGSLAAAAAFLGPDYDAIARQCYTQVKATDVYKFRSLVLIPWTGSVASSDPLKRLIDRVVTPDVVQQIAREHAKGRRFYVGTTNLSTGRFTVWDMGAVASRGGPAAVERCRNILLASCSIPGMFSPIPFEPADGRGPNELHADGGITANLFLPPGVLARDADGNPTGTDVYAILAHKWFADPLPVKQRVPSLLAATVSSTIHAGMRAETVKLYHLTKAAGANFHLTAVPDGHRCEPIGLSFDSQSMNDLYDAGLKVGAAGPGWQRQPPAETAVDRPRD